MPIIACPHCGTRLEAPQNVLGRQVVCGKCSQRFVAAAPPAEGPAPSAGGPAAGAAAAGATFPPPPPSVPPPPPPAPQAFRPPPPPPTAPWPYAPPGPMPSPYGPYAKPPGTATAAMVLGILSLAPGCCCWPAGLICAILAIVYAGWTTRDIAAGLMDPALAAKASAGRICGIVGLGLAILGVIWMIFNLATGGLRSSLYNFRW